MRTSLWLGLSLVAANCLAASSAAIAQPVQATLPAEPVLVVHSVPEPYARSHLYMGAGGAAVVTLGQSGPRSFLQSGGGFNVFFGGRANRWISLELDWQPTFHSNNQDIFATPVSTLNLHALTADIQLHLLRGSIQPYLTAGGGVDVLAESGRVLAQGPGFQVGAGVDFWLNRFISLGLKAQYRGAKLYGYNRFDDDTYLSLLNIQAVLAAHFPDAP